MTILPVFCDLWPLFSEFVTLRDLQALCRTSSSIRISIKNGFEAHLYRFFSMKFSEQEEAADSFLTLSQRVAILWPESPVVPLVSGEIHRIRGLFWSAKRLFKKIDLSCFCAESKAGALAMTAKAIVKIWEDEEETAKQYLEQASAIHPSCLLIKLYQFTVYKYSDQDKAFSLLQYVLKADPSNLHAKARYAEALFYGIGVTKNQQQGIELLQSLLEECKSHSKNNSLNSQPIELLLATFNKESGNFSQVVAYGQRVLKPKKKNALYKTLILSKVYILLADTLLSKNLPPEHYNKEKVSCYLSRASLWAKNSTDRYRTARLFVKLKDSKQAIKLCDKILKKDSEHFLAQRMRGLLLYSEKPHRAYVDLTKNYAKDSSDETVQKHLLDMLLSEEVENAELLEELLSKLECSDLTVYYDKYPNNITVRKHLINKLLANEENREEDEKLLEELLSKNMKFLGLSSKA
jgi:hypothetical protein